MVGYHILMDQLEIASVDSFEPFQVISGDLIGLRLSIYFLTNG